MYTPPEECIPTELLGTESGNEGVGRAAVVVFIISTPTRTFTTSIDNELRHWDLNVPYLTPFAAVSVAIVDQLGPMTMVMHHRRAACKTEETSRKE